MNAFIDHIKPYIDNVTSFRDALKAYKKRAYRMTASRNIPYHNELDKLFVSSPVQGIHNAYFIEDNYDKAAETLSFQTGGIYLQNPSSVLPAQLLAE